MNTARHFAVLGLASMTLGAFAALSACEEKGQQTSAPARPSPAVVPAGLFLTAEPAGALPVEDAKKAAEVGQTIAVRGRIGGSVDPFVDGRAVFTLMGPGLKSCSDNPDDACETPWDYCCETKEEIAAHMATVQVTGTDGKPVKASMKGQGGLKEASDVVVVGTVAQADGKNLVVNATGLYLVSK